MNREEFKALFASALETAAQNAEHILRREISRQFGISLHGAGHAGDTVSVDDAAEILFLGEDAFYRIIDVAVCEAGHHHVRVFVRVSGHPPVPFQQTWNSPPGCGPFKQVIAQIKTLSE